MNPAPGYDDHLPHDLVHFVVEEELGLKLGIFGQLAAGGTAGTFRLPAQPKASRERSRLQRKLKQRGERLALVGREDAEFSEKAAAICHREWLAKSPQPEHRTMAQARALTGKKLRTLLSETEQERLSEAVVRRVCERLTELAEQWSQLAVGEALTLEWTGSNRSSNTPAR